MGQSKQEFIDIRMDSEYFYSLDKVIQSNMEIRRVFEEGWEDEFKKHDSYNRLKKENQKTFTALKEIKHIIKNK